MRLKVCLLFYDMFIDLGQVLKVVRCKYFEGSNAVRTTSMRIQKTTPIFCSYVMFESKKLKFLLLIRRKEQIEPKKVQLAAKKSFLEFRGFRTFFLLLATPYVMLYFFWLIYSFHLMCNKKGVFLSSCALTSS